MPCTSVANCYNPVGDGMLTIRCTCVDGMHMVDATASGILLYDPDTHCGFVYVGAEIDCDDEDSRAL